LIVSILTGCAPGVIQSPTAQPERSALDRISKRGTLVIATEKDFPPQSLLVNDEVHQPGSKCDESAYTANQMTGFDVEVAVNIARRLNVEPCFVAPAWSQLIAGGWGDLWDINVGSMVITPERMENLYFTQPYASGEAVVVVHLDNQVYKQPSDLSGKRVGVCAGCAYEDYLRGKLIIPGQKINYVIKNAKVFGYDTDTSALADLAKGDGITLDAVITDPDTVRVAIDGGMPVKILGSPVYHDYVAAAIDKKSSSDPLPLVEKITEIIQEMHKDGTLRKLSEKFYGGDFTSAAEQFSIMDLNQIP
jgi:polar amino acid transport system substrate-binding protein